MIHTGLIQIQLQAENGNEEVFGGDRWCALCSREGDLLPALVRSSVVCAHGSLEAIEESSVASVDTRECPTS